MKNIELKKGQKVKLKHLGKADDESSNWSKQDNLELGQVYTVSDVDSFGWFLLKGNELWHSDTKFELINDKPKPTSILSALGKGQKHGQTAKKLRTKLGLSLPRFMEQVHELRKQGHWICADNSGYYLAANTEEKQRLIKSLKSRVKSINEVIKKLDKI